MAGTHKALLCFCLLMQLLAMSSGIYLPISETLMHKDLVDVSVTAVVDELTTSYDLVDRFVLVPLAQPKRLVVWRTARRSASRSGTATA